MTAESHHHEPPSEGLLRKAPELLIEAGDVIEAGQVYEVREVLGGKRVLKPVAKSGSYAPVDAPVKQYRSKKKKRAISLSERVADAADRAVVEGRAPSVSAYIEEAMDRYERDQPLQDLLTWMEREGGEPAPEERQRAEDALRAMGITPQ